MTEKKLIHRASNLTYKQIDQLLKLKPEKINHPDGWTEYKKGKVSHWFKFEK